MSNASKELYKFDKFCLDVSERLLSREGERISLSEKAFDTLCALVRHGNHLVGKDELLAEIWADAIVEENNLDKNISLLRQVLGERAGKGKFIETVRGHGFRFVPEVREVTEVENGRKGEEEKGDAKFILAGKLSEPSAPTDGLNFTESQISNFKFQAEDQKPKTENQTANGKKSNRFWLVSLAVFSVLVFGLLGFYFWRGNAKPTPIKSVAVLPFKSLVAENRDEALELGMADALISKLSGGEEVIVRPLSAIRKFNSVEQDSVAAGRELGVESVLDGSIQTWGDRIRVSAKLLRTSDGKQLWTGQFDENFTDIFAVQDSISEKVAAALKIRLGSREKKHYTENVEAYQLYMKGRYHLSQLKPSEFQTGISYLQQAIDIDPNYALAYAALSNVYRVQAISGEKPPTEVFPKAKAAANKAVELDDTLPEAYVALGLNNFWYDWDWSAAENHYRRALELDPNIAIIPYAHLLSNTGRHAEALAIAKRTRELDPLDLVTNALEGQFLLHAGRVDEALDRLQKTSELEPNFWMPHFFASSAYVEKGMFAEAIAESDKEKELSGGNVIPFGAYALAKSGKSTEARAVLEELLKLSKTRYVPPYNIALIYNGLEERANALEWLERAYEQRDPKMTFLKVEPKWNNLRNEPRFIDLMNRMKL
jgi:DNA-binding winged helix-turn-helix (wHTH) protein/TolB-like protein